MYKLTVFNPDGSIADVLLISDTLAIELTNVLENSKRESLDLAGLREIKLRALSVVSKALKEQNIKTNNPQDIQNFAICTLDWFGSLLDVILLIEELPNPNCLYICLSNGNYFTFSTHQKKVLGFSTPRTTIDQFLPNFNSYFSTMTLPTNFALGDIVQVIDPQEPPSEWATFTIIEKFSNSYRLSPLDKFTYEPLWVTAKEIALTQVKSEKLSQISVSFKHLDRINYST